MEIVLIRHAEPEWIVDGRVIGDPGLTPLGVAQARSLAIRVTSLGGVTELLVSPARRSQDTMAEIERNLRQQAVIVSDLNEIRVPWDDSPAHAVEEAQRRDRDRPPDEWWDGFTGGETFREFHLRVTETVDALLRQRGLRRLDVPHMWHDEGAMERIVIVAHGGTNAVILGHLLDLPPTPWEWERFISNHASITRLRSTPLAGDHVMSLVEANGTSHLSRDYLTR